MDLDWYEKAKRSGEAARDIYDRDSVEYELALHLLRALRELEPLRAAVARGQERAKEHGW